MAAAKDEPPIDRAKPVCMKDARGRLQLTQLGMLPDFLRPKIYD